MFCKYCGAKIDDNSEYCKFCGGAQNSDTYIDTPTSELGHAYHKPDPYGDEDDTTSNGAFDPFNDAVDSTPKATSQDFTNPFDREIRDDLSDIDNDQSVIDSCNSGYIMKDGKQIKPRYVERTSNIPPSTYNTTSDPFDNVPPIGMSNTGAHMRQSHDALSDHDRTLAILTLVMAFVCPIAGIFIGRRFYSNIAGIPNPDPYYLRIARMGIRISYIDTAIWAFFMVICLFLPLILLIV